MRLPSKVYRRRTVAWLSATLPLGFVLLLYVPVAAAQKTLGELLDAGATKLSTAEFNEELVQRLLVGPTGPGGSLEIMYTTSGIVRGVGSYRSRFQFVGMNGTWKFGDQDAVCTVMTSNPDVFATGAATPLPSRCQFWFKLGGQYFLADSDWDRSSAVLSRTVKQ